MKEEDIKIELTKLIVIKKSIVFTSIVIIIASCSILKVSKQANLSSDLSIAKQYSKYINKNDLKNNLTVLASDDFEGRETTKKGQKKAAEFIKEFFVNNNVQPPKQNQYFQNFSVNVTDYKRINIVVNNEELKIIDHFYCIGSTNDTSINNKQIVDVKYGISTSEYDNYKGLDVKGKIVLINEDIPAEIDPSNKWTSWRKKVLIAKEKGALAVICIKKDYEKALDVIKPYLLYPEMKMHYDVRLKSNLIPYICISKETHQLYFKKKDILVDIEIDITYDASAENVMGFVKGETDEIIVISAHYDHLGFDNGEICNGADDDGSGTVCLMSIAKAFQKAKNDGHTSKRSILFLAVSGEEKGLFGSKYYTDNPLFPLENTVADLNIDMVGRVDTIHNHSNYIYLIGSDRISKDLHEISEKVNKDYIGFELDYTYNDENDPNHFYYRSDHYNFAKNGVPVIFYFSGLHEDYHKPTDDVEKINFDKLEKTAHYVFLTAWELANREKRIR